MLKPLIAVVMYPESEKAISPGTWHALDEPVWYVALLNTFKNLKDNRIYKNIKNVDCNNDELCRYCLQRRQQL